MEQQIMARMLNRIPNDYPKHIGSYYYEVLAPIAKELVEAHNQINDGKSRLSIDNLSGDELTNRVKERSGIERKQATFAVGIVTVTGTGTINIGDRFETQSGIQFTATEQVEVTTSGNVPIRAVVSGISGNVAANTIILFPVTLSGFTAVTNPEPMIDGFAQESDEELIKRYYDKVSAPATSNNISQIKSWANSVAGVGDSRIVPLWDGVNTVKVIVIDSDKKPASEAIVSAVKDYIDPSDGLGEGMASAGNVVTVVSADALEIDISVDVDFASGYDPEEGKAYIINNIINHLRSIAFVDDIVSYGKIGAVILSTEGVNDYANLTINDGSANISIDDNEVAVIGDVAINE